MIINVIIIIVIKINIVDHLKKKKQLDSNLERQNISVIMIIININLIVLIIKNVILLVPQLKR